MNYIMMTLYSVYYDASSLKKIDHILNSHHHYRDRHPLVCFNLYLERELIETVPTFIFQYFRRANTFAGKIYLAAPLFSPR